MATVAKPAGGGDPASSAPTLTHVALIAAVASLVLFWKLGSDSLAPWDEAIYAQVARETARGEGWLTLHWAYRPWFEKPPLFVWITAAFFRIFGVSEFWARAASALSGVALAVVTYLTARLGYDRRTGLLASAVLLTSYHFLSFARFGTTDVMLALLTTLAAHGYLRLRAGDLRWWYLVWLSAALALMLKGAGGLVVPALVAVALVFDRGLGGSLRSREFWLGCALALLVVAPWHALMWARYGRAFTDEYVGYHVVARLSRTLEGHASTYAYYFARLIDGFFPWVLVAPFAIVSALRENARGESRSRVFLVTAALVFVLYTLVPTRRAWYIVPLYPALSILVAALLSRFCRARGARSVYARARVAGCALLLAVGAAYSAASLYLNRRGLEPLAALSRSAARDGRHGAGPLIIFSDSDPIPAQVPLFYGDRPVRQAYLRAKPAGEDSPRYVNYESLDGMVTDAPQPIIMSRDDAALLSAIYEVRVLEESGPLVYAIISRRG